jgi:hypothetical protein
VNPEMKISAVLKNVLDQFIKTVTRNCIKLGPVSSRLLAVFWQELGSEHTSLLPHTEVQ